MYIYFSLKYFTSSSNIKAIRAICSLNLLRSVYIGFSEIRYRSRIISNTHTHISASWQTKFTLFTTFSFIRIHKIPNAQTIHYYFSFSLSLVTLTHHLHALLHHDDNVSLKKETFAISNLSSEFPSFRRANFHLQFIVFVFIVLFYSSYQLFNCRLATWWLSYIDL